MSLPPGYTLDQPASDVPPGYELDGDVKIGPNPQAPQADTQDLSGSVRTIDPPQQVVARRRGILMDQAPQSAVGNFAASALEPVTNSLPKLLLRGANAVGALSDDRLQQALNTQVLPSDTSRTSGVLGSGAGMAAESLTGPVAPFLFAGQAMEGATENIEARAQQGQTASAGGQIADVVGQGLLNYALGKLAPGQQLNKQVLAKMLPELGSVAKNMAARAATAAGISATEAELNNIAGNALSKYTGVNPDQGLLDNSGNALLQGAVLGGIGQGAHDLMGGLPKGYVPDAQQPTFESPTGTDPDTEARLNAGEPAPEPAAPERPRGDIAFDKAGPARSVAEQRASSLDKPMFLYSGDDGKFYVDSRQPDRQAFKVTPDGNYEMVQPGDSQAPAEGERRKTSLQTADEFPPELDGSKAVGDWYGKQFNDKAGAPFIESMASMKDGKYILADVDPSKVDPSALQPGDKDPAKVQAIADMTPEERAKLPPAIFTGLGDGLVTADGSHRLMAAQKAGDASIRAYVPADFVGKPGVEKAGTTPAFNEPEPAKSPVLSRLKQQAMALAGDDAGGTDMYKNFAERTVIPEAKSWQDGIKQTYKNVNRFLGTGIGETRDESRVKGDIRSSLGEQDLDRIRTEQQFKPFRALTDKYTDAQKTAWVEAMEGGKQSPDARTQGAFDLMKKMNAKNKADAAAVGIDTSKWNSNDDYVARMAVFPDEKPGAGGRSSIAGTEHYLKGRTFDTYGEFKRAVEAAGGEMRYDNPLDVAVAKNVEVRKSIGARKLVNDEMARGTIKKLQAGEDLPPGHAFLDDRLARSLTKTRLWTDPATGKPRMKPAPRLIAPEPVANQLNQYIAPGIAKTLPIWSKIVQMKRGSVGLNFALSAFHVPVEAVGNASIALGQALDNAVHGEFKLAGKNVMRAFPWEQARFGSAIREQARNAAADPSLEPIVQASAKAGQRFNVRSVLDPTSFEKARKSFAAKDPITGTAQLLKGLGEGVTAPIMEHYVPNLKAGAMAMRAETMLARTGSPDAVKADLVKAGANVDNVLGQVVRSNQFQHKVITDLTDGIFSAPKFMEGSVRYGGALARDTAAAFSQITKGEKPTVTPAMYTFAGYALTHAVLGASIQAAYTAATTGKPVAPDSLKDYFYPRTGRKNADGSAERISVPDPMSFWTSAYSEGAPKAVSNRIAPLWRSMMDVVNNADYRNVQVRSGGVVKQAADSVKHVAASQLPFSVNNAVQKPTGGNETADFKVAGVLGIRKAPTKVSESAAEAMVHDLSHGSAEARTQEQADRSDLIRGLSQSLQRHDTNTYSDIRAAVRDGKLQPADVKTVFDKAKVPPGLVGELKSSDLAPADIMKVWAAATPEEKRQIQWVVRGRIARSETTSMDERRGYLDQVKKDMRPEAQ